MTRQRHKALPEMAEVPAEPTGLNFLEASKAVLAQDQAKALQNISFLQKLIRSLLPDFNLPSKTGSFLW
jgi:hypothetical protein